MKLQMLHTMKSCISVRCVDTHYDIHEDVLGLVQLPDTKSETLFSVIKDVLIRSTLPLCMSWTSLRQGCKHEWDSKRCTSTSEERM